MDIHQQVPLKNYTTMRLGGSAAYFAEAHTAEDVATLHRTANAQHLPIFVLGGGSNTIVRDEGFAGLIVHIKILGFEVLADDIYSMTIKIGAGENWDKVVERTVVSNLSGIEALSAIPGTAGGAPVQNIGAYGQELADTLVSLEAYDTTTSQIVTLQNADCQFAYRSSIFREAETGRYIITSITLKLSKNLPNPPFYEALQRYFDERKVTIFTQQVVRDAVIDIRRDKLPNPIEFPNAGSFFKNAIIEDWQLHDLKKQYPDAPSYEMSDGRFKIPTGWLIEQTGFKGQVLHGMRIHDKNALVLINHEATGYADLAAARQEIVDAVYGKFRIPIEQEPLEL